MLVYVDPSATISKSHEIHWAQGGTATLVRVLLKHGVVIQTIDKNGSE